MYRQIGQYVCCNMLQHLDRDRRRKRQAGPGNMVTIAVFEMAHRSAVLKLKLRPLDRPKLHDSDRRTSLFHPS